MELELSQIDKRYAHLRVRTPSQVATLIGSISTVGQQNPVLVTSSDDADGYTLVDGYLRVTALTKLCRDTVEATVLPVSDAEGLIFGHRLAAERKVSVLEEAWLIAELHLVHSMSLDDIAGRIGRTKSWVSRRLALVTELPATAQDAIRRGAVPAHAATRVLVPLARANTSDCEVLVKNLTEISGPVPSRALEQLWKRYKTGDAKCQERLVKNPGLFFKSQASQGQWDVAGAESDNELRQRFRLDLEILENAARRCQGLLDRGVFERGSQQQRDKILRRCTTAFHRVSEFQIDVEARRDNQATEVKHAGS